MKSSSRAAFTLIEMLTVMSIIAILTSLVIATSGYVTNKAARTRAQGEITEMASQCESYKTDFGSYPQSEDTDQLDPKLDANPATSKSGERYQKANLTLYSALSGDNEPEDEPDGRPEKKAYISFTPNRLKSSTDDAGQVKKVKFIQDPFGNPYGYSTMGNAEELAYRKAVRKDPKTDRIDESRGYNPNFDLWSTAGKTNVNDARSWVKNWGN